ncbi:fatty acid amide hydrolase-like [Macadamia integrifolia]|uniref:fatty acid amide hydrolase-like n=1 Tax=Macadamia integrifolia TaxID=60698 RepID=UPI001C5289C7|nr:fatty acid amide hydrolase-like [Macadamia integrifolia]
MGKKRVMLPVEEVDLTAVKYEHEAIQGGVFSRMGNKRVMLPVEEVDLMAVKYEYKAIQAPHLTGFALKFFVWLLEAPLVGSLILCLLKKHNRMIEEL